MVELTPKQAAVLALMVREGNVNEEQVITDLWPLVSNARLVMNALERKGMVRYLGWVDDECGAEYALTELGRGTALSTTEEAQHG
jgi:hypothetical protein